MRAPSHLRLVALATAAGLGVLCALPSLGLAASSNAFLPLSGGARAYGMSGARVVLTDDANAVFLNPARLTYVPGFTAATGYARLVEGVRSDRLEAAFSFPVGQDISAPLQETQTHRAAVGVGIDYLGLDLSEGSSYSELQLNLSAAWAPINFASIGGTARVLVADSEVEGISATGAAFDLGMFLGLFNRIDGSVVLRNLTGQVTFKDRNTEDLVRSAVIGLALTRSGPLSAELDFTIESESSFRADLGAEFFLHRLVALRGGVRQWMDPASRTIFSAGLGVRVSTLEVDYGAQLDESEALGLTQKVSLVGRF